VVVEVADLLGHPTIGVVVEIPDALRSRAIRVVVKIANLLSDLPIWPVEEISDFLGHSTIGIVVKVPDLLRSDIPALARGGSEAVFVFFLFLLTRSLLLGSPCGLPAVI
jgi:hypothetical protein